MGNVERVAYGVIRFLYESMTPNLFPINYLSL